MITKMYLLIKGTIFATFYAILVKICPLTPNVWQSLARSPPGIAILPSSEK